MTRRNPGYGSRYRCPTCDQIVPQAVRLMYGPFAAHGSCKVKCGICDEVIDKPRIGQRHLTAAWLYKPVHLACKQKEMQAAFAAPVSEPEDDF